MKKRILKRKKKDVNKKVKKNSSSQEQETVQYNKKNNSKHKKILHNNEDIEIKNTLKEVYFDVEKFYYNDEDKEQSENKTEDQHQECCLSKLDEVNSVKDTKNHSEDVNDDLEVDDDDDLRFSYNQKMMQLLDDEDYPNYISDKVEQYKNQHCFQYIERESWSDDPKKVKFKQGDIVVFKNNKYGPTYKICYPSQKEKFYFIKESKSLTEWEVHESLLEIAPPDNNKWETYWSQYPVIPAPKNFKKKNI